ncbi:hypothetical protein [Paralysiella testudinis]|uniref:Uncharacterized protein n=1 Tax=Paralysiella testudinis TaxID=2809020 RepID=A0A892ZPU3_9NEIS|nr:hypothetical protein [Paralysiella testudinis]QRQ82839.1 hypothetical protein JQU52_05510 [Paralysiella testudinis]
MDKSQLLQQDIFNKPEDKYAISSQLLRACIGGSTRITTLGADDTENIFHGFQYSKKSIGYIFLCTLLYNALHIRRYPYKTDRIVASLGSSAFTDLTLHHNVNLWHQRITPQQWHEAEEDIKGLYGHVQKRLSIHFPSQKTIYLKRHIQGKYAFALKSRYCQAKEAGLSFILLEMDLLNSYMSLPDYGYSYAQDRDMVVLTIEINLEDILYCHSLIRPYSEGFSYNAEDTEEGEWVVINRTCDGVIKLPLDAISFPEPYKVKNINHHWYEAHSSEIPCYIRPEAYVGITHILRYLQEPPSGLKKLIQTVKRYF